MTQQSLSPLTSHLSPIQFAVRVTRHDKSFPLTSRDLEIHLGSAILSHFRGHSPKINSPDHRSQTANHTLKVNLTNPDLTLYVEILKDRALLYTEKIPGPGGLPVGTAGKALCLLSGGFDSVAAAYLMAKRGLKVDFLHFHIFDNSEQLKQTKIWTLAQFLSPIVHAQTLHTVSCPQFQSKLKQLDKKYRSQKLILSRRFMIRTALQLAHQHGYQALITGDSLGQVASQTLSNLTAVDDVLSSPGTVPNDSENASEGGTLPSREVFLRRSATSAISSKKQKAKGQSQSLAAGPLAGRHKANPPLFRPLIGMDKVDIINLVKKIGLYDEVIKPYQDCCSLAATHPSTHTNLPLIHQLEKNLSLTTFIPEVTNLT